MSRYSNRIMKNNVHATLSTAVSSIATTIQLTSGQGERFGNLFPILATLESISDGKVMKREIVQITSRSGDALVVERAFAPCPSNDDANSQTQTSFSFDIDDTISMYIPKEFFDNIADGFTNAEGELDGLNYDGNARMKVIKAVSGTPLKIDIVAGVFRCGGDTVQYAGTTDVSVSDNSTNYVMIDGVGTIQISTSARDTRYTRLAEVVTSGGIITSISDRRSDVVGGTLGGLEIHSLMEKTNPNSIDELVIADSETSFTNKRISVKNLIPPHSFYTYDEYVSRSDNEIYGVSSNGSNYIQLLKNGLPFDKNGNTQMKSISGFNGGCMVFEGYIYYAQTSSNTCHLYRCNIENDISVNTNWTEVLSFSGGSINYLLGFDGENIVFISAQNPNKIYKFDKNFNANGIITLNTYYFNGTMFKSTTGNGKYYIRYSNAARLFVFGSDGTEIDRYTMASDREIACICGYLYNHYASSNEPRVPQFRI